MADVPPTVPDQDPCDPPDPQDPQGFPESPAAPDAADPGPAPAEEEPEGMTTWTPPRGLLAKTVSWVILIVLAACILGVAVVAILRLFR